MLLLQQPALTSDLDLETMLDRFDRPWSETLGARVLEAIATAAAAPPGSESSTPQLSGLIKAAGPSLPTTSFDRALALTSDDAVRAITTRVSHDFDVFAHQIRLRQRLHQEIAQ